MRIVTLLIDDKYARVLSLTAIGHSTKGHRNVAINTAISIEEIDADTVIVVDDKGNAIKQNQPTSAPTEISQEK